MKVISAFMPVTSACEATWS